MPKIKSINPATQKISKEFDLLTFEEAQKKLEESRSSFKTWKNIPISKRAKPMKKAAQILLKNKKEYGKLITTEMGKPISSAIFEIEKCAWLCKYFSENAEKFLKNDIIKTENKKSYVNFEPLGVILGIMPWNYPFWQVFRFAVSTLCAGNVVIIKHASNVPQCALEIEKIFSQVLPKNVFKTLLIDSQTALALIERVDGVSITGSVEAGRKVAAVAGSKLKKMVMELGGSDPFIVLKDADIEFCCKNGVQARILNSGQSCIAAKRFIVVKDIAKEFEKKFVENIKSLKIGDPLDKETDVGPLAREDLILTLERQVRDAVKKGGKILLGGYRPKMKGYFYMPTVISNIKSNMSIVKEETFGPITPIIFVKDEKEAIKEANNTEFGLGASVWSKNIEKAEKISKQIEAGVVFINGIVKSNPRLPFGGVKKSGFGRELGSYGVKEFVNIKTIVIGEDI